MILNTIREKLNTRRDVNTEENGSDVVVTLFMIPFVIGLVFSLIDVSSYFQTRSEVQNAARDGARQVALYGGSSKGITLNTSGKDVSTTVMARIYANGGCIPSGCTTAPRVTCGPNKATSLNADAYCTINYNYRSFGGALVEWLGFDNILSRQINITEKFKVETRY